MVHTPIIPNRHIVYVLPLIPDLQIMVLYDQLHKPVQEVLALVLGQTIDPLYVVTDGEDRLPTGDWIGADHGVNGLEGLADIFGRAARGGIELEVVALRRFVEAWLGVVCDESVEEGAEGRGDAVIEFVARGPESVWGGGGLLVNFSHRGLKVERTSSGFGKLCQPEQGIITRDRLEGDIRVPLLLAALVALGAVPAVREQLLGLLRRDDADLIVLGTVFALGIADRVDVKAGCGWLACQLAQPVNQLLLQVIGQVVLLAEKDYATLGDFWVLVSVEWVSLRVTTYL